MSFNTSGLTVIDRQIVNTSSTTSQLLVGIPDYVTRIKLFFTIYNNALVTTTFNVSYAGIAGESSLFLRNETAGVIASGVSAFPLELCFIPPFPAAATGEFIFDTGTANVRTGTGSFGASGTGLTDKFFASYAHRSSDITPISFITVNTSPAASAIGVGSKFLLCAA